MWKTGGGSTRS
ncbi:unnamed protein product [Rhodiola kirilowii]